MEVEIKPQSLPPLIAAAIEEFSTFSMLHAVQLTQTVPASLPPVLIDPEKIERVLTNLLDNAIKFTPSGGAVMVRASLLHDSANQPTPAATHQKYALVEVLDSGPGIPAEYQERIFDRYVQVAGREGRRRGTGLGLAFCKLVVEAHAGQIWVVTRPEGGSAFCFTLPLAHIQSNS
jgi:NtrC-family two-component system sensor histidine kinase KinB